MLAPMGSMSDESRVWWRKLGRNVLSKLVLSTVAAIGTKLGEHIVDAVIGKDDPDDDDDDGPPGAES
jgi:hypothetical protein